MLLAAVLLLTACSSDEGDVFSSSAAENQTNVTLTFSPYQVDEMTRAATPIAGIVTRLDVWLYESGSEAVAVHQSSSDSEFGALSVTLDKTKTYTIYAVGHKGTAAATLADGIIAFPDDKTTHSMYFTTTFSPSTTTSLSCLMQRIVAQFRIETTDAVPANMKKIQIAINDVFDRWSVTAGGTQLANHTHTISITSTAQDGTVALNVFAIVTDAQTLHTVTVTGLDADDAVTLTPRTFDDVPLRNGYRTTYRGALRDASAAATFTVDDWSDYDVVEF